MKHDYHKIGDLRHIDALFLPEWFRHYKSTATNDNDAAMTSFEQKLRRLANMPAEDQIRFLQALFGIYR